MFRLGLWVLGERTEKVTFSSSSQVKHYQHHITNEDSPNHLSYHCVLIKPQSSQKLHLHFSKLNNNIFAIHHC